MAKADRIHLLAGEDAPGDEAGLLPRSLSKQEFGRRLYRLMARKGWRQSELARRAGLNRDQISTYVRGASLPTDDSLRKLATALGVEPTELLPNRAMSAIEADSPALEIKVSPGDPRTAFLRVNMLVPTETAVEVVGILHNVSSGRGASD
jgi:transcriptional regulator with XRE-family HTH domain